MSQILPTQANETDDVIRLQQAYDNLAKELELHYKKGTILKKELERAIKNQQIQAVLEKVKKIKT
ncbi:MAG: hypothetical protein AAB797_02815 [Patescibacteria group bacterium]